MPAEAVFAVEADKGGGVRVLLAGAGCGKSTLLRRHLADSADRWLSGELDNPARSSARPSGRRTAAQDPLPPPTAVPVLIRAVDLAGTPLLARALATAVIEALGPFGLREPLDEAFFRDRPRPHTPWLVLVDGLDEVPDQGTRIALLDRLAREAEAGQEPSPYRFVVATRPLPYGELDRLGPDAARFSLQPFTPADVLAYARKCFGDLPDPERHVKAFRAELKRSGLGALARTPLMASMLCQLYAADPTRPLPEGRTGAYQSFVELLYEQNSHKGVASTHDAAIRLLKGRHQIAPDIAAAEQAAQAVRDHLRELIDLLADRRLKGNTAPAVETLASHLHVQRPAKVKEARWHAFLGDLLRPTGVLSERAGDFDFLHHSLLEYHAARHATRDEAARARVLEVLFPRWGTTAARYWQPPRLEPSYLGFLLDGLLNPGDTLADATAQALDEIAVLGGDATLSFLTAQVGLRTCLPPHATALKLARFAERSPMIDGRARAAGALAELDGHQEEGARLLAHVAARTDTNLIDGLAAARRLAALDGHEEEGVALLTSLATDPAVPLPTRVNAAAALAAVDGHEEEGLRLLTAFATDPSLDGRARLHAAEHLARMDAHHPEDTLQLLADFAANATLGSHVRMDAARFLAENGDERAAKLLIHLATDTGMDDPDRTLCAATLARLDGHRQEGAALLARHVTDTSLHDDDRVAAAQNLATLDNERAGGLLAALAADTALGSGARAWAASILAEIGGAEDAGAR
ncbi:NACHT domain-containing protein [Streptomyces sp. NPDC059761]|uniref:NACHT domain-containing protein n=1 Tax=Streptomyces sp. NPDC059761 TaxID=3346937 RepID=UPI00364E36EF